ncbi:hypothetical protein GCM10009676_45090 [Prauserella halophila]|uniref:Uncharacterized protein n=1 Tax=Prauserella halophila TaxID=185641 RepID=A0ABN1WK88_9PSEU|nr:hypothetical protein [Prauserella halophila]
MELLQRAGEFTGPEMNNGACFSSEPSIDALVSLEFSRDTVTGMVRRYGLELGNIHGRAAVELDMTDKDLGCRVVMEMDPEEVVMLLFDGGSAGRSIRGDRGDRGGDVDFAGVTPRSQRWHRLRR